MEELAERGVVAFRTEGNPPEIFHLMFEAPGLAKQGPSALTVRSMHRCDVYLHRDYPRRPPVFAWQTPIFHPNILGPESNGGVCIGSWSASESLADLTVRIIALASYRAFNADDPLNREAAEWIIENDVAAPADVNALARLPLGPGVAVTIAGGVSR